MTTRIDLYATVHAGIRVVLYDAASTVGRAEFADPEEATGAVAAVRRALGFLDEHTAHEDAVILPELHRVAPELHADLEAEHARVLGLQREIEGFAALVERAGEPERVAAGARLRDRLPRLVAEHLRHMAREETEANRALWANRTDAELQALHDRIVGAIPPARMAEWLAIILPAAPLSQRAALVGGLRSAAPPHVFDALVEPARAAMGAARWARTLAAAA